jgi:TonB family protein
MTVDRPPSVLERRADRLGPWLVAAVVGHGLAAAALVALHPGTPPEDRPWIDPSRVIEVELLALAPKGALTRPTKASAPPPSAAPPVEGAPPVRVSDLTAPSEAPDPSTERDVSDPRRLEQLRRELEMERLLGELDGAEGPVDRAAASPDGVEGATESLRGGAVGDPEFAAYIASLSKLFLAEFRPLPVLVGKGYRVRVLVRVDSTGVVSDVSIATSSGNASYDGSAERAARAVPRVPLPPERFRALMAEGYGLTFRDP